MLWLSTAAWLAGCGRLGFDLLGDGDGALPDAAPDMGSNQGSGGAPKLAVTMPTMTTECGNAPTTFVLEIKNTGDAPLTVERVNVVSNVTVSTSLTRLAGPAGFELRVAATPWTIAIGDTLLLEVLPPTAVIGNNLGGETLTGAITLETNADADPTRIDFAATVVGANLVVTSPPDGELLFQGASGGCPAAADVTFKNAGNAEADISQLAASGFNFTGFTSGAVTMDQEVTTTIEPNGQQRCQAPVTIPFDVTGVSGPICQPAVLHVTFDNGGASSCACS